VRGRFRTLKLAAQSLWRGARPPRPRLTRNLRDKRANSDLSPQAGRGEARTTCDQSGSSTGLDAAPAAPHCLNHQSAGRPPRQAGEESPGSMDMRCRITSGGGDPRDSATENRPPRAPFLPSPVWGRVRRGHHGKGETVRQERTALAATQAARQTPPGAKPNRDGTSRRASGGTPGSMSGSGRPGRLLEAPGNRRSRGMAVTRQAWPGATQNPAYRLADM
jgi:hypothetical protein